MLMQTFFKTPRTASIITTIVFFFTSFLDQAVNSPYVVEWKKTSASLLPTISMSRAMQNIFAFETSGQGLQPSNLDALYYGHRVSTSLYMFVVSGFAMGFIGLFLETYDLKPKLKRFLFPGTKPQDENDANNQHSPRQENYEVVNEASRADLLKLERDGNMLSIVDLRKTFSNGFVAVKGLNVKMYTG